MYKKKLDELKINILKFRHTSETPRCSPLPKSRPKTKWNITPYRKAMITKSLDVAKKSY